MNLQVKNYKLSLRDYRNRLRFWLEQKLDVEISKKTLRGVGLTINFAADNTYCETLWLRRRNGVLRMESDP